MCTFGSLAISPRTSSSKPPVCVMRLCSVTGLPNASASGTGKSRYCCDVAIEIELALLDQLHHCGVRHELRDRTRAEQRALADRRAACVATSA